jgi:hypothetical protein
MPPATAVVLAMNDHHVVASHIDDVSTDGKGEEEEEEDEEDREEEEGREIMATCSRSHNYMNENENKINNFKDRGGTTMQPLPLHYCKYCGDLGCGRKRVQSGGGGMGFFASTAAGGMAGAGALGNARSNIGKSRRWRGGGGRGRGRNKEGYGIVVDITKNNSIDKDQNDEGMQIC